MFWADALVDDILKAYPDQDTFVIRDEKTLSGRVHVGSLRGVVIHGILAQILRERGKTVRFIFEYNDFDPMDALPQDLVAQGFDVHMGKPLCAVPSPKDDTFKESALVSQKPVALAKNFAEYYGDDFLDVIHYLGFEPETPRASDTYKSGRLNNWIRLALTRNKEIRAIYKRVSGSEKPEHWSPVQVVCQHCGRVGSTDVVSFDGEKVRYTCLPNKVKWAKGCGHEGEISPFDGNAELTWKVEWPAKWDVYGVTIEGSGKDHNAAGGSHAIAEAICAEISHTPVPFNVPYEFLLSAGKKMSSSKGFGATAREMADLLPPELLRYLLLYKKYSQTVDFDPYGETIPRLFDAYDAAAAAYFSTQEKDTLMQDTARAFQLSLLTPAPPAERFLPRFSQIVFMVQIPRLDVYAEVARIKGAPLTDADRAEVALRERYARIWLAGYAPEAYRFTLQETLPPLAATLTPAQTRFLDALATALAAFPGWQGEAVHGAIHACVKSDPAFSPKDSFAALYTLFLAKTSGPQVGWFLSAFAKDWVLGRLRREI